MRAAGILVLIAGVAQAALGIAALGSASGLEANVAEIESNEDFGRLYLSLGAWGLIALGLGLLVPVLLVIGRVVSLIGWQSQADLPAEGEAPLAGQMRHG